MTFIYMLVRKYVLRTLQRNLGIYQKPVGATGPAFSGFGFLVLCTLVHPLVDDVSREAEQTDDHSDRVDQSHLRTKETKSLH